MYPTPLYYPRTLSSLYSMSKDTDLLGKNICFLSPFVEDSDLHA